jgi:hypothetical protein
MLHTKFISSKKGSASSTTISNDRALADYRRALFLSDNTLTTVTFHSSHEPAEKDVILAAKRRMAAKLLAFDNAFSQYTEELSSRTTSKTTSGSSLEASPRDSLGTS